MKAPRGLDEIYRRRIRLNAFRAALAEASTNPRAIRIVMEPPEGFEDMGDGLWKLDTGNGNSLRIQRPF